MMAASFWERVGERAGYAMAAVVLGPYAAAVRHERRVLRRAFHGWLDEIDAERLEARAKSQLRRAGNLRGVEPLPFEAEIDLDVGSGRVDVALALGKDVSTYVSKVPAAIAALHGVKLKLGHPVAKIGSVRVDRTSMDESSAIEIARDVARTELRELEAFTLEIHRDRLVLEVVAPRDRKAWLAIEKALAVLAPTWTQRWTSYR